MYINNVLGQSRPVLLRQWRSFVSSFVLLLPWPRLLTRHPSFPFWKANSTNGWFFSFSLSLSFASCCCCRRRRCRRRRRLLLLCGGVVGVVPLAVTQKLNMATHRHCPCPKTRTRRPSAAAVAAEAAAAAEATLHHGAKLRKRKEIGESMSYPQLLPRWPLPPPLRPCDWLIWRHNSQGAELHELGLLISK